MRRHLLILLSILLASCRALEGPMPTAPDERPSWLPSSGFEWTKAEDVETRTKFLRNFGVGYSYNAVRGSFCDWADIRCQIVNRQTLEEYQYLSGETLCVTNVSQSVSTYSQFNYSKRDYVAAVHLETDEKIDIGLYNKEKRTRQDFLEDGVEESFYYNLCEEIIMADTYIVPGAITFFYETREECDNLLTLSFVNAVRHVAESDPSNMAVVDSLINIYGTHVITAAWLGGKIRVDLSNYMWRYKDEAREEEWDASEFLNAINSADASHSSSDAYTWLEHGKLSISAYGGDQSSLTGLLGEHAPDGTRSFSTEGISRWRQSLFFDPENEYRSNVELVDMRLTPIWEFAEAVDPDAAERIRAAIQQDISVQESLLGESNFFDTSFPIRYPEATAWYRQGDYWTRFDRTDSPEHPMIVNIVSGGRYVASVCHETIGPRDLWVCYPIYEGKIKLSCGTGVDSAGRVFSVRWINGKATVVQVGSSRAGDTFYISGGEVDIVPREGVSYAPSHALAYIELAGGVQPDGSYDAIPYLVEREDADFVIRGINPLPQNIVGWAENGYRLTDYVYIYNPNELHYE